MMSYGMTEVSKESHAPSPIGRFLVIVLTRHRIDVGLNFVDTDEMTLLVARNSLRFFAPLSRSSPIRITGVLAAPHEIYLGSHVLHPPVVRPQLSTRMMVELSAIQNQTRRTYESMGRSKLQWELAMRVHPDHKILFDDESRNRLFLLERRDFDIIGDLLYDDEQIARAPWGRPYAHSFPNRRFFFQFREALDRGGPEEEEL